MRVWVAFVAALLFASVALWPATPAVATPPQPWVVIAHPAIKASSLHVSTLRALFLRQTEQLAGERIVPINYPAGQPLRTDFDARVLGMNGEEVGRFWIDARIRGVGSPPRTIAIPQLVVRAVALLPGAISYVPTAQLTPAIKVKVLRVDGLTLPK